MKSIETKPRGERLTIGVLAGWQVYWSATHLNFLMPLYRGIYTAVKEYGCNLMLACGIDPPEGWRNIHPAWPVFSPDDDFVPIGPWNTDGLIIVHPLLTDQRIQYMNHLVSSGHPVVFVGAAAGPPAVAMDNEGGISQVIAHLVDHGHHRIAFISGQPEDHFGDSGERLRAYHQNVRHFGLADDPRLVAAGSHSIEGGERAMQQILDSGSAFTAVVASNDESAFGA
ncbi:MAG: LacI family transcriptional regulator, partial [Chloroflexota bacterium]